jgi:WD40 repeat protein
MFKLSGIALLTSFLATSPGFSQNSTDACPLPAPTPANVVNLFDEQQEMYLGDVIAAHIERNFKVVRGPQNDNLQRIGDRLAAQIPNGHIKFRFTLVDTPIVNAFSLPGGRVFVTRKMVAATHAEDELAGVLAHEISHTLAKHSVIEFSIFMRELLRVTSLGGKEDIATRYHQLEESYAKKKVKVKHNHEDREQLEADRIGFYIAARAGYRPEAHIEFWDRAQDVHGDTGNWFSDLFGTTRPESKRLREMLKVMRTAAPGCAALVRGGAISNYKNWQQEVIENAAAMATTSLPGLMSKQALDPPLRSEVSYVRFSRDGKYVLAQDNSSLFVLQTNPLQLLFRVDAKEALPAQFTPDTREVLFYDRGLRVERWSIAEKARVSVHEMTLTEPCLQTELSPRGDLLACFNFPDLRIVDVATNEERLRRKGFYAPTWFDFWAIIFQAYTVNPQIVALRFSPDGQYFLAGKGHTTVGFETNNFAKELKLPGAIRSMMGHSFDFQSDDRLVGVNGDNPSKSAVVRFPTGEPIAKLELSRQRVSVSANPDLLLLRPIKDYPLGIFRISTNRLILGNTTGALDADAANYVGQTAAGELTMFPQNKSEKEPVATLRLPRSPLSTVRSFAISDDLHYLAISDRTRGAIYDLRTGRMLFLMPAFRGTHIRDGVAYAEFPKTDDQKKRKLREMQLETKTFGKETELEDKGPEKYGRYLIETKPEKKEQPDKNLSLVVQNAESMAKLWSRPLPKDGPGWYPNPQNGSMVFVWNLKSDTAKNVLQQRLDLGQQAASLSGKDKDRSFLLEAVELDTGKTFGHMILATGAGSFEPSAYFATTNQIIVVDQKRRVLVYSLASGEIQARMFADRIALSPQGELLALDTEDGKIELYDLDGRKPEPRQTFIFPSRTSIAQFSQDAKRLIVVTEDQNAFVLDLTAPVQ